MYNLTLDTVEIYALSTQLDFTTTFSAGLIAGRTNNAYFEGVNISNSYISSIGRWNKRYIGSGVGYAYDVQIKFTSAQATIWLSHINNGVITGFAIGGYVGVCKYLEANGLKL